MCSHPCAHDFQVAKRPVHREGRLTLHFGRAVLCDAAGKRLDEETVPRRGTGGSQPGEKNATKKDDFEMIQGGHKKIVAVFSRCKNKHKNNDVNQPLEILSNGRTSWSSTFFGDGKDQTSDMMHGTMADNWVEDGRRTFWVAALIDQMVVVRTVWKGWLEPTRSWPAERPKKEMALPMGKKEELWVVNVLKILDFELQRWWLDVMSGPKRISEKATRTGSLNASINIS